MTKPLSLALIGTLLTMSMVQAASPFTSGHATVRITEISPHKVSDQDEWFEFSLSGTEAVDLTDWQVSNGKSTKTFGDKRDQLVLAQGGQSLAGATVALSGSGTVLAGDAFSGSGSSVTLDEDRLIFLPENTAWFFWKKSPVSLGNSGGTVRIIDEEGTVRDEIAYPKTKSGTRSGHKYAEVWNRTETDVAPLVYHSSGEAAFRHSRGEPNHQVPALSTEIELVISEISPDRDAETGFDFVELYVKSTKGEKANLKYLEIKHNGTPLIFVEHDWWVEAGDFIVVQFDDQAPRVHSDKTPHRVSTNARSGLSSGSGTVEVIVYAGTSFETTEDVVCWQDETLSQTERNRVDKFVTAQHWSGDCIEIGELIDNESAARQLDQSDTNSENDFFRHFNGSEGLPNDAQNNAPTAVITVQRTGRTMGLAPFSLNLTGEGSTDPDGAHDLQSWQWTINGAFFSDQANPPATKLENIGTYDVELVVTDFSGAQSTASLTVEVVPREGNSTSIGGNRQIKQWLEKALAQEEKAHAKQNQKIGAKGRLKKAPHVSADFFTDFLARVDMDQLRQQIITHRQRSQFQPIAPDGLTPISFRVEETRTEPKRPPLFKRDLVLPATRQRLRKNLGLIFLD